MYARRIPIPSLHPNLGFDYVFFAQAKRIEIMRYKQRGRYKYIGKYGLSGLRMPRRPPKYKTR